MKKRLFAILFTLILCMSVLFNIYSAEAVTRMVDDADILSASEEEALSEKLDEISLSHGLDVVIVTTYNTGNLSPTEYADDYFDYNGYAEDGILLLISMEERDWRLSTTGYGITVFTDAGLDYISEEVLAYLSEGEYALGFNVFADLCDEFIRQAEAGTPYDINNLPKAPFDVKDNLKNALIAGAVLTGIIMLCITGGMKSVRRQPFASSYEVLGSMKISRRSEMFLYNHVSKRVKANENGGSSTHRSSSGRSHGGRGGKF